MPSTEYLKRVTSLVTGDVVNLGIGLPTAVTPYLKDKTFTAEYGIVGGTPLGGQDFGKYTGQPITYTHREMFEEYSNGLIDTAILGVGEFDLDGNVNVHSFGDKITGCGGFMDIVANAKRIIFCASDKKLRPKLESVTFNPQYLNEGQEVFIVTETQTYKIKG